jgi:hypothetical protein
MEVRITKQRVALAALFVVAGVGLGSLLSPLVGSALANVGQVVNISDHSASAYFAKVTSAGELKTNGVVSGKVAPALPPQPFSVVRGFNSGDLVALFGPTSATVALTDVSFSNTFTNQARRLSLYEESAVAPNTGCVASDSRSVGVYNAPSGETVVQDFTTPIVLKPLTSGDAWCLVASMVRPVGDSDDTNFLTVGGYVLSGTFTPPPGKAKVIPRRTHADPSGG